MARPKNVAPRSGLNVSIPRSLHDRLVAVLDVGPYRLTINAIVTRGINLAVEELEKGRAP